MRHRKGIVAVIVLLAVAALAQQPAAPAPSLPTEDTVNSFVRHYFGYNPDLAWRVDRIQPSTVPGMAEVLLTFGTDPPQRMRLYVSADGQHAIIGDAVPFGADPFRDERELLAKAATGPALGAGAAVLVVEFSDLQCPHCKQAHPTLEQLSKDVPQAKLVFQHFPLPGHDWARKAAAYADCVGRKDPAAFWKFVASVYEAQQQLTPATADARFTEFAAGAGLDGKAVATCANDPATAARVQASVDLGKKLNVTGTPTVFVNGRRISSINSLSYEELKAIVEFEVKLAGEKTPR